MSAQARQDLRLLKLADAAEVLGLEPHQLYKRVVAGDLPTVRMGRCIYIREVVLEAFAKGQPLPDTAPPEPIANVTPMRRTRPGERRL